MIRSAEFMIYRKYSSIDTRVSAIGFGGMRFRDEDDIDTCAWLVKAAYDKGINYFDTAPGYERSEEIFGVAIQEMKKTRDAKPFYISTKTMKTDAGEIREQLETSLKRMNLDYIDFYHLWCVFSLDDYCERKSKAVMKEFERLKDEGLIKHICISTHASGPDIIKILSDYPFEGILLGYSVMNFAYRQEGLDAASKLNRAVVVMNPLGGGLMPNNPERFSFVRSCPEETVVEAALRFLINEPRITIILVGFSDIRQLNEAISAVDGYKPIPAKTINKIRSSLQKSFNELCTSCRYCDKCPQGINVPRMMDVYNHYVLSDRPQDFINRLRYHWGIKLEDDCLQKCTGCRLCESACTQKLPICDRFKIIRREVKKFLKSQEQREKNTKKYTLKGNKFPRLGL